LTSTHSGFTYRRWKGRKESAVDGFQRLLQILVTDKEVESHFGGAERDHFNVDTSFCDSRETSSGNALAAKKALTHNSQKRYVLDFLQSPVRSRAQTLEGMVSFVDILSGQQKADAGLGGYD